MAGSSGKAHDSKRIDYFGGDITLQTDIPKAKAVPFSAALETSGAHWAGKLLPLREM